MTHPAARPLVVLVHPDDVNVADAKALAAQHGATVEGNRYIPRGQMFLTRPIPPAETTEETR